MVNYEKEISTKKLKEALTIISEKIKPLKIPPGFFQFTLYAISELFSNIDEHSRADKAKVRVKMNSQNCLIEIADNGVGLRKSYLAKKIYPKDDFSAIEFALAGLSTKEFQERGFGLYTLKKFIEPLEGKMVIETGRALAEIEKNKIEFVSLSKKRRGVKIRIEAAIKEINFYKYLE